MVWPSLREEKRRKSREGLKRAIERCGPGQLQLQEIHPISAGDHAVFILVCEVELLFLLFHSRLQKFVEDRRKIIATLVSLFSQARHRWHLPWSHGRCALAGAKQDLAPRVLAPRSRSKMGIARRKLKQTLDYCSLHGSGFDWKRYIVYIKTRTPRIQF